MKKEKCPKCGAVLKKNRVDIIFRHGHYYCVNCPEVKKFKKLKT